MMYEEDLHCTLDKIMKQQHAIMTHIINMAQEEISTGNVRQIEEALLEKEFENLQKNYIELRKRIHTYKIEDYRKKMSYYTENLILTKEEEKEVNSDEVQKVNVSDEVISYIKDAYYKMQFISDDEIGIPSIYEGEEYEDLRNLEYELYQQNFSAIEEKEDIDCLSTSEIPYKCIATIIEELAEGNGYKKGYETLSKMLINLRTKPNTYKYLKGKDRETAITKLTYKKYEEKFKMLNSKYNGVLTDEIKLAVQLKKLGSINGVALYLGVSEDDFNKIYKTTISDYMFELKEDVRNIFPSTEKKQKNKKSNNILAKKIGKLKKIKKIDQAR